MPDYQTDYAPSYWAVHSRMIRTEVFVNVGAYTKIIDSNPNRVSLFISAPNPNSGSNFIASPSDNSSPGCACGIPICCPGLFLSYFNMDPFWWSAWWILPQTAPALAVMYETVLELPYCSDWRLDSV